ncbi:uncharacterized protein [Elaeis guineensis]|uniref:uncharacterized protein n=1 Tax=Elaeis guineensis var. tenera TaxID=51953 RepID=UPI003C6D5FEF
MKLAVSCLLSSLPYVHDIHLYFFSIRFERLLRDAQSDVYLGCKKYSLLSAVIKLLHMKTLGKWSNNSFNWLLKFLKDLLPEGELLPSSHYEAKKLLKGLGLGVDDLGLRCEKIHACPNDCVLFRKDKQDLQACPICHSSRWKESHDKDKKKKKIPCKILRYFPITPRLRRLFMSRHTACDMRWHKEVNNMDDDVMRHPSDGDAWKHFDREHPWFAADSRNVRLGLATDGFNPYGNLSTAYSMWPVMVFPYNLPSWKCMKSPFNLLALLIPGPRAPGRDIDIFLEPLIEELQYLWEEGCEIYDHVVGGIFRIHAALLWTVNDFPAYGDISGWCTKGYKACPTCNDDITSDRIREKICFTGHRRFLPDDHRWRRSLKFNGKHERRCYIW